MVSAGRVIRRNHSIRRLAFLVATFLVSEAAGAGGPDRQSLRELAGLGFTEKSHSEFHFHLGVPQLWLAEHLADFEDAHGDVSRWASAMGFAAGDYGPVPVVVFNTRDEYTAYASRIGLAVGDAAGFYAVDQDLLLFVRHEFAPAMQLIIRHEVAHAVLYRMGVHRREVRSPPWLVEGLACLFEVDQKEGAARLLPNPWRLADVGPLVQTGNRHGHRRGMMVTQRIQELISRTWPLDEGDGPHSGRYALASSLVFFLNETNKDGLKQYLQMINARPAETAFTPAVARSEFSTAFGPPDAEFVRRWGTHVQGILADGRSP